ncbi:MAG TPA: hypothetical protein VFY71_18595 [Planctomycetota bacterium]|nr:hypothetical protein [Planctomycetota bacterium]
MTRRTFVFAAAALAAAALLPAPAAAQCQTDKVVADVQQAFSRFGRAVALSGNRLVVGAPDAKPAGLGQRGLAYVYHHDATGWTFEAQLKASDGAAFDEFGVAVAIDGDTILVGADGVDSAQSGAMGRVYAFDLVGTQWVQVQEFTATDAASGGFFGFSVALQGDTAVIGRFWDNAGAVHAGSAYVFRRSGGTWAQTQKLLHTAPAAEDDFGWSVALDGGRAVVGASERFSSGDGDPQFGRAFVYTEQAGSFVQTAVLAATTPQEHDQFGISVDIAGDEIVVGAWQDFFSTVGSGNGEAFVFDWDGSVWQPTQKLVATDGSLQDEFGSGVAIQGDRLIVGAASRFASFPLLGGVYAYQRVAGAFVQTALFLPDPSGSANWLGNAVAMDGNAAVAGAFIESVGVTQGGSAYTFGGLQAWTDLGAGLAGAAGVPSLLGTGTLCAGQADQLTLGGAAPSAAATLVFGLSVIDAPFKGGTLVPTPLLLLGLPTDASGAATLPFTLPAGIPPDTELDFQVWVPDAGGPHGLAASNGLRGVTP